MWKFLASVCGRGLGPGTICQGLGPASFDVQWLLWGYRERLQRLMRRWQCLPMQPPELCLECADLSLRMPQLCFWGAMCTTVFWEQLLLTQNVSRASYLIDGCIAGGQLLALISQSVFYLLLSC